MVARPGSGAAAREAKKPTGMKSAVDADPGIKPNCPKCPRPLLYITSLDGSHYYQCPEHGGWRLDPDGLIHPVTQAVPGH